LCSRVQQRNGLASDRQYRVSIWGGDMIPPRPRLSKSTPEPDISKLLILLEQWTRADVMSRIGEKPWNHIVTKFDSSCAHAKVRLEDEIKQLLYDSADIEVLAVKFGIPCEQRERK